MDDLIRRQNVIDALELCLENDYIDATLLIKYVRELPSVEQTAKVCNQMFHDTNPNAVGAWIGNCECGSLVTYSSKYCPACGKKLRWG